jgi:hypothetical protein
MINKILNIKEESYSSKLDIDSLKNKIEKLYEQKNYVWEEGLLTKMNSQFMTN